MSAALADSFRDLWDGSRAQDILSEFCARMNRRSFWPQAWLAIRQTMAFDGKGMQAESLASEAGEERKLALAGEDTHLFFGFGERLLLAAS